MSDFIKVDGIGSDTYKPQVSKSIWNFLTRRIDHSFLGEIEKDLEKFSVSIKISDDHEQLLLCGSSEGIELCKQRLSEVAATVVETQKTLQYPGVQKLFRDQDGLEWLQKLEKEMCVEIEIVMPPVPPPQTLSLSVKSHKTSPEDDENRRERLQNIEKEMCVVVENEMPPVPLPRTLSLSVNSDKTSIYNMCDFTTKEGIKVSWKYGRIEKEQADVLVNSANSNLNDHTPCGRALMTGGGPCYSEACKPHTDVQPGDIVVTESGALLSKYVIHAVFCDLIKFKEFNDQVKRAQKFLEGLLEKILEKCQELGASSLAMPVIGTGKKHGFPEEAVLGVIKNKVKDFSSNKSRRPTLNDIRVIVLNSKTKRRQSMPLPGRQRKSASCTLDQERKTETTISAEVKVTFGHVSIFLFCGNVTQYKADGLVVLHSKDGRGSITPFKCTSVVQSSDENVFAGSTQKYPKKLPPGAVLVKAAGHGANIKHSIYCSPVSSDVCGLKRAVKACMDAAKFFGADSILISAKKIASFGVTSNECADVILKACEIFSNANYEIDVRVVVPRTDLAHVFKVVFEETVKKQTKNVETIKKDPSGGLEDAAFKQRRGDQREVLIDIVGFQHNINQSIQEIEAYVHRNKERSSIKSKKLVEMLQKYDSDIMALTNRFEVLLTLSGRDVIIEGMKEQVFECKEALTEYLIKEEEVKRFRVISESVQWSYSVENGMVLFDDILNGMVENEFREREEKFTIPETEYEVNLTDKIILDNSTGHTAQLTRKHVQENALDLPGFWEPQPEKENVYLVTLSSSSREYQKVIDLFHSAKDVTIVQSIARIQNPRLYKLYLAKKESMGKEPNEKQLFHGTKTDNISSINTNNFNRRFSGINGVRFGHGVYFARDALYSLRFSQKDCEEKEGPSHMYVAKVLVGKSVKGKKGMRVPPKQNDPLNPESLYDSAVDDTVNPSIFVTFDDHQCYPEYLITFTTL